MIQIKHGNTGEVLKEINADTLSGAVVLMFLAAWLAHFMFSGGSK